MNDPLTQVIGLLQPSASFSKLVTAAGAWTVHPPGAEPFYGAVLDGGCLLSIPGHAPTPLAKGDFLLIPAAQDFTVSSLPPPQDARVIEPVQIGPGLFHLGAPGTPDTRLLVGYCRFASHDTSQLVSLLPDLVVVRGQARLTTLVELLSEEAHAVLPGRDVVLSRLLEVLLIEAFRTTAAPTAAPGLLRGLADKRLAVALRCMHDAPARPWTIGALAKETALSRSAFFERFRREVGVAPMEYLLSWRMAIARALLRGGIRVGEVAQRVGYGSSSTFSVAFTRHMGMPPAVYAREHALPEAANTPLSP